MKRSDRIPVGLFSPPELRLVAEVNPVLREKHYLGEAVRGEFAYSDEAGVLVFTNPDSRHLPQFTWLGLSRWCLTDKARNAGSQQWRRVADLLRKTYPTITTVVSYSDPSVGHTGALYRACNWLWAPTWLRLAPPPTGNGSWTSRPEDAQSVKDRWVFPLRADPERARVLGVTDESVRRRFPWAEYREPRIKRGRFIGGGGDYRRWIATVQPHAITCDMGEDCVCSPEAA